MLINWFINKVSKREPDFIVGGKDDPYLLRWHVIKWGWFNIYLHAFLRSDDDRALHDHVGDNVSMLLKGQYKEWMQAHPDYGPYCYQYRIRRPGLPVFRRAEKLHRIELLKEVLRDDQGRPLLDENGRIVVKEKPVWSLWWRGRNRREWGFLCRQGWRHWKDFCDPKDTGVAGRGCD